MFKSTEIIRISGIPIKVHFSLWIVLPLIALAGPYRELFWGLAFALGLFTSVALHELGHSLVAQAQGIRVREILLLPIGGMAKLERLPTRPRDEIAMALAGPAVSLLLALLLGFLSFMLLLAHGNRVFTIPFMSLPVYLAFTNLVLAFFNLMPSFPMDGGRVFRAWMTPRVGKVEATRRAAKIGRVMAIAFGILGLLTSNMFLILVAVFVYFAAAAEYKAVQFEDLFMRNVYGGPAPGTGPFREYRPPPPPPGHPGKTDDVIVDYAPSEREQKRARNVFDDLYADWK